VAVSDFLNLAPRLVLLATFLAAGAAKVASPRQSMKTLHDFGVPRPLQWLGALLAPAELLVALGLLFGVSTRYAAAGAAALLAIFILGISANLIRGRRPDCNCFGQVRSTPIGWPTLVRDGLLAACAGWLLAVDGAAARDNLWTFFLQLDDTQRRIAIVVGAVTVFAMLHSLTRSETRGDEGTSAPDDDSWSDEEPEPAPQPRKTSAPVPAEAASEDRTVAMGASARSLTGDGLPIGTPAPEFVATDFEGREHSLSDLLASGLPLLLVFSTPTCPSCQVLMPRLPALANAYASLLHLVLITRGTKAQNAEKLKDAGALRVLVQQQYEISEGFNCTTTPSAVFVDSNHTVQSTLAAGPLAIEELIKATADRLNSAAAQHSQPHQRDGAVAAEKTPEGVDSADKPVAS
jgi:hypothetical protein